MAEELDPNRPLVLLIGITSESVTSALKTGKRQYKSKSLDSKPANWELICQLFDDFKVGPVMLVLTGWHYRMFAEPEYQGVKHELLKRISKVPHAVFVFESLAFPQDIKASALREAHLDEDEYPIGVDVRGQEGPLEDFTSTPIEVLNAGNALFREYRINVLPYRRNAELSVLAGAFLEDTEEGLLFKCYVPKGKLWSGEIDSLLGLFREYLTQVRGTDVRLDLRKSKAGTLYRFKGEVSVAGAENGDQDLNQEFQDFSRVLAFSVTDPQKATAILRQNAIPDNEAAQIVERYAKEKRRLEIDLRQSWETKVLSIRHRLEVEISEKFPNATPDEIGRLVNQAVDSVNPPTSFEPERLFGSVVTPTQVSVTVGTIINSTNAVVAQEINGNVQFGPEATELLEYIAKYGGPRRRELEAAVQEFHDVGLPVSTRIQAKGILKGFVSHAADKLGDVAVALAVKYLEQKFGI